MPDASMTTIPVAAPPEFRRHRIEGLDVLRGLAALSVVLLHQTRDYNEEYHPARLASFEWTRFGSHGVTLFFLISGFVIFMTVERTKRPIDFVISRFSRLYPTYWAAIFLTTMVLILFPIVDTPAAKVLVRRAVVNLTMFQYWFRVNPIDGVYWTLQVEMSFYLIMLFLIWRKATHLALAVMTGLVVVAVADHLLIPRPISPTYNYFRSLLMLDHACMFTAGMVFYRARSGWKWSYLPILLLCVASPATNRFEWSNPATDTFVGVGLGALVYAASVGWLDFLTNRFFLYLGTISYSLYVIHHQIGFVILERMNRAGIHPDLALLTAFSTSMLLAIAMNTWIERPSLRWIRDHLRRPAPKAEPTLATTGAVSMPLHGRDPE